MKGVVNMTGEIRPVLGLNPESAGTARPAEKAGKASFADTLKGFASHVDQQLKGANQMADEFAVGKRFDLHEIMVATEKADLSLRLLMQIRNKLLDVYQEVMRMQF
jgi:flagellar hook-basal body complex protein FliE